jgi:hypothetical protein
MTLATAIVDTHALLQLIYVSLIAGVGVCGVYAVAVVGITRSHERRKAGQRGLAVLYAGLAVVALAGYAWAAVTGVVAITTK